VLPDHGQNLNQLQGPVLLMQRGAELPRELNLSRRSPQQRRPTGNQLRL
jgi:hypothetical protein